MKRWTQHRTSRQGKETRETCLPEGGHYIQQQGEHTFEFLKALRTLIVNCLGKYTSSAQEALWWVLIWLLQVIVRQQDSFVAPLRSRGEPVVASVGAVSWRQCEKEELRLRQEL